MISLREWFKESNVDWDTLVVLVHAVTIGEKPFPGWEHNAHDVVKFKYTDIFDTSDENNHVIKTIIVSHNITAPKHVTNPASALNALLDYEFDDEFGGYAAPPFVAEDKDRTYFICEYDGATRIEHVHKDLNKYFDIDEMPV